MSTATIDDLKDPHAEPAPEPEEQPAAAGLPAHQVALYDPATGAQGVELAANFDPHRHIRWEHRPALAELDLGSIKAPGSSDPLLGDVQVKALTAKGLTTIKAILRAGRGGLKSVSGVGATTADLLYGWAMGRAAAKHALAELQAEASSEPEASPAVAVVIPVPVKTYTGQGGEEGKEPA